jgi:anti-sigma-K factor RskA
MRYDRPELGERLAADYVLGTMPRRARYRFERVIAHDATLAARVAGWADRLQPLDTETDDETPPARVWRAIERRLGFPRYTPLPLQPRIAIFTFWRGLGAAAIAACAAIALYVAVSPVTLPKLVAELADKTGLSGWTAAAPPRSGDIGLSLMTLGISERERPRWLRAALLLSADSKISVTIEPPAPR